RVHGHRAFQEMNRLLEFAALVKDQPKQMKRQGVAWIRRENLAVCLLRFSHPPGSVMPDCDFHCPAKIHLKNSRYDWLDIQEPQRSLPTIDRVPFRASRAFTSP